MDDSEVFVEESPSNHVMTFSVDALGTDIKLVELAHERCLEILSEIFGPGNVTSTLDREVFPNG